MVLLSTGDFYAPLVAQLERAIAEGFEKPEIRGYLRLTQDPHAVVPLCEAP
jgi:predicted Rossmann-fold nucleotide-binding protein